MTALAAVCLAGAAACSAAALILAATGRIPDPEKDVR